jgi:drug/metabolite transporter (DMT)-like permease
MTLVILTALCVAGFAILFKYFDRYAVPLFPAITINYFVAFVCGLLIHPPWDAGDVSLLWLPAAGLGCLFVTVFTLTGLSAQKAGATRTTIAGRMSLVLTVLGTMFLFHERIGVLGWIGILLAVVGLVLSTQREKGDNERRSWFLPVLIFLGSGACDIGVNALQRTRTTILNEAAFTTMCFGAASCVSLLVLFFRKEQGLLMNRRVWIGGLCLGIVNYASLLFLIASLGQGRMPASTIFPLMNVCAILFSTVAAIVLFGERSSVRRSIGIALCIVALVFIMLPM